MVYLSLEYPDLEIVSRRLGLDDNHSVDACAATMRGQGKTEGVRRRYQERRQSGRVAGYLGWPRLGRRRVGTLSNLLSRPPRR
jgi:hypothetical protein